MDKTKDTKAVCGCGIYLPAGTTMGPCTHMQAFADIINAARRAKEIK